jgi:hypothetical protein
LHINQLQEPKAVIVKQAIVIAVNDILGLTFACKIRRQLICSNPFELCKQSWRDNNSLDTGEWASLAELDIPC